MTKTRTAFEILGVTPADDMTAIRMAWRAKVRALHPDRADDKRGATRRLAEVNAAFDALQGHRPKREASAQSVPVAVNPVRRRRPKGEGKPPRNAPDGTETRGNSARANRPRAAKADPALSDLYERALAGYIAARQNVKAA